MGSIDTHTEYATDEVHLSLLSKLTELSSQKFRNKEDMENYALPGYADR